MNQVERHDSNTKSKAERCVVNCRAAFDEACHDKWQQQLERKIVEPHITQMSFAVAASQIAPVFQLKTEIT